MVHTAQLLAAGPARRYFYFKGATLADRIASNYVVGSNASDVGSWVDESCTFTYSSLHYMCEFEGECCREPAGWQFRG